MRRLGIDAIAPRLISDRGDRLLEMRLRELNMKRDTISWEGMDDFMRFMDQNRSSDFLRTDLLSDAGASKLDFTSFEDQKDEFLALAKAYQRLLRIVPEQNRDVALALLGKGIHSALQIAQMTRKDFLGKVVSVLGDEKLADDIYQNALKKRGVILLQYLDVYQNNEPHIKAARFS
jgi:hypothetical protein